MCLYPCYEAFVPHWPYYFTQPSLWPISLKPNIVIILSNKCSIHDFYLKQLSQQKCLESFKLKNHNNGQQLLFCLENFCKWLRLLPRGIKLTLVLLLNNFGVKVLLSGLPKVQQATIRRFSCKTSSKESIKCCVK